MWRPSKDFDLWNFKNTEAPSTNTCKTNPEHLDIKHLRTVAQEGLTFFTEENCLYAETQVLTRIIYRMKKKFRSSKDFKSMERLNRLLNNYFSLNIKCSLQRFIDLIPRIIRNNEVYLPTKNMLDFILVRLQGLSKLMERVVESTKICGYLFNIRIRTGHFWKLGFILFAIVSRIHVLARHIIRFMCQLYNKLVPFSSKLTNTGDSWLPDDYNLPKKLDQWLEVDWLDKDDDVIEVEPELPRIIQYFDLLDDDDEDIELCDEYVLINDTIRTTIKEINNTEHQDECKSLKGFDSDADIGEVIVSESKGSNKNFSDRPTNYSSEAVSRDNILSDDSTECIAALSDEESSGDSKDGVFEDVLRSKKVRTIFKTCYKLKKPKNGKSTVVLSDSDRSEESKKLNDTIKTTLKRTNNVEQPDECKNLIGFDTDEDIGEVIVSKSKKKNKNFNDRPTHYSSEAVNRDSISSDGSTECIAALSDKESSGDSKDGIPEDVLKSKKVRTIFKTCYKLKKPKNDKSIVVLSDSDKSEESKNLSDSDVSIISAQSVNNQMNKSSSDETEIVFEKEQSFKNEPKKRKVVLKRNVSSKKLKTDVVELSDSEQTDSKPNDSIAGLESSVIFLNDSFDSPKKTKMIKKKLKTPKKVHLSETIKNTFTSPSKKKKQNKVIVVPEPPKTKYHSEMIRTQKNENLNATVIVLDESSLVATKGSDGMPKRLKSISKKRERQILRKAKFLEKKRLEKLKKKQLKNRPA